MYYPKYGFTSTPIVRPLKKLADHHYLLSNTRPDFTYTISFVVLFTDAITNEISIYKCDPIILRVRTMPESKILHIHKISSYDILVDNFENLNLKIYQKEGENLDQLTELVNGNLQPKQGLISNLQPATAYRLTYFENFEETQSRSDPVILDFMTAPKTPDFIIQSIDTFNQNLDWSQGVKKLFHQFKYFNANYNFEVRYYKSGETSQTTSDILDNTLKNTVLSNLQPASLYNVSLSVIFDNFVQTTPIFKPLLTPKLGLKPEITHVANTHFTIDFSQNLAGDELAFYLILEHNDELVLQTSLESQVEFTFKNLDFGQKYLLKSQTIYESGKKSNFIETEVQLNEQEIEILQTLVTNRMIQLTQDPSFAANIRHSYLLEKSSIDKHQITPSQNAIPAQISDNHAIFKNLQPNANYKIFARKIFSGTESTDWHVHNILTAPEDPIVNFDEIYSTSAKVSITCQPYKGNPAIYSIIDEQKQKYGKEIQFENLVPEQTYQHQISCQYSDLVKTEPANFSFQTSRLANDIQINEISTYHINITRDDSYEVFLDGLLVNDSELYDLESNTEYVLSYREVFSEGVRGRVFGVW